MFLRKATVLALCATALAVAPVLEISVATPAAAQSSAPTTIAIQAAITAQINIAKLASGYASLSAKDKALRLANAVQAAVAAELSGGAAGSDVSAALANLVSAGFVSLSIAAQGAAQGAQQVASAGGSTGAQALQLVSNLSSGSDPLGAQIASSGGLDATISATNGQGQTITVVTSLGTVLALAASGNLGNVTTDNNGATLTVGGSTQTNNNSGYTPCTNVVADYC